MDMYINSLMYNKNYSINKNKIYESLGLKNFTDYSKSNKVKKYNILKKRIGVRNVN